MTDSLKPVFDFSDPSSGVILHEGSVDVSIDKKMHSGTGHARLDFLPSPRLSFFGHFDNLTRIKLDTVSSFSLDGKSVKGFAFSSHYQCGEGLTIRWDPNTIPYLDVGSEKTHINKVIFHLFNFPAFISTEKVSNENGSRISHMFLNGGQWEVEVRSLNSTHPADPVILSKMPPSFASFPSVKNLFAPIRVHSRLTK